MVEDSKATIVSVYFGELPYYFDFTKKTIQHNKGYQWIIAGDMFTELREEGNILFVPYTLSDLSRDCSRVIGADIHIKTPYKACDTKILWPEIFNKYIKSNWVGWSDLDCIFGDLDTFITKNVLTEYDVITYIAKSVYGTNIKSLHGPFTLHNKNIIGWYKDIPNLVEKLNYSETDTKNIRKSYIGLDELFFAQVIDEKQYKVYEKYKPYENRPVELPIIFNGRRRVPAQWKDGKIFVDSVNEDYNGRFPGLHSMFLHIRKDVYVDIKNCEVVPEVLHYYKIKDKHINVHTSNLNKFNFIKDVVITLKYLHKKIQGVIFSFEKEYYTTVEDVIKIFAPEINTNTNNYLKINDLNKLIPLTMVSPMLIEEMRELISNKRFPDKVYLYSNIKSDKSITHDSFNIEQLSLEDLLSVFCNSSEIISELNHERNLMVLMKPESTFIDICVNNGLYDNIFKQLLTITAKKRHLIKKQHASYNVTNTTIFSEYKSNTQPTVRSYTEEGLDYYNTSICMLYEEVVLDPRTNICLLSNKTFTPVSEVNYINTHRNNAKFWIRSEENYALKKHYILQERKKEFLELNLLNQFKTTQTTCLSVEYTYVNLLTHGSYAYGHLLDITLRLFYLPKDILNVCFLVSPYANITDFEFIIKTLSGYQDAKFKVISSSDKNNYRISKIYELNQPNGITNFNTIENYNTFINLFINQTNTTKIKYKLFLARISPLHRHIVNFNELEIELKKRGVLIMTGTESFLERVYLMGNSTHVCGYHGALFFDTCFCPTNARILEYAPQLRPAKCFLNMYKRCTEYYFKVINTSTDLNCVLDLEEILKFYNI